jgi:hypothetical protein
MAFPIHCDSAALKPTFIVKLHVINVNDVAL